MGNCDHRKAPPCFLCLKIVSWIPVFFISAVIVWSYYAYVVQLCIFSVENTFERITFLIFYHIICVLFFWSYAQTIFTPVAIVPQNWRIPDGDIERVFRCENIEQQKRMLEQLSKDFPITNRTINGSIRFCDKCKVIKPDRAHHCSVCRACVLKMDHHCPWVNNCVNFKNYKFFVLFLGYALLYCIYVAVTSLEYFISFWRVSNGELNNSSGRFHILFLFFVSLMFAISLVSLFGYHIYLVLMNRTTLEAFRAPIFRVGGADKNGFNLGKFANFQEVFGDSWKLWLLPVYTSKGDGIIYPTQTANQQQATYDSMGDTPATPVVVDAFSSQKLYSVNSLNANDEICIQQPCNEANSIDEKHMKLPEAELQALTLNESVIINIGNAMGEEQRNGRNSPNQLNGFTQNKVHPKNSMEIIGNKIVDAEKP